MNIKIFLKKMNRGVALGIAVLIGFAVYIQVDKKLFTKEKPELEQLLSDYVAAMSKVSVDSKEMQLLEKPFSKENITARVNQILSTASEYWEQKEMNINDGNYYYYWDSDYSFFKNELMNSYLQIKEEEMQSSKGYITENTPFIKSLEISKTGPINAEAQIEYSSVVKYVGSPLMITLCGIEFIGPDRWGDSSYIESMSNDDGTWIDREYTNNGVLVYATYHDIYGEVSKSEKYDENGMIVETWNGIRPSDEIIKSAPANTELQTETFSYSSIVEFVKIDGEWKISSIEERRPDDQMMYGGAY